MRTISLAILSAAALMAAPPANAAVFNVMGTAMNTSGGALGTCGAGDTCSFSGTLDVDVTNGNFTAINITFPGLSAFAATGNASDTSFGPSGEYNFGPNGHGGTFLEGPNVTFDSAVNLEFPGSLVGFAGGSFDVSVISGTFPNPVLYKGSGTASVGPAVPESSTWAMLLIGFVGLGFAGYRARMSAKIA